DPASELRPREEQEAGDDQQDADDQPHPSIGLEVVSEDPVLQVLRQRTLVAERPDRIDDPHEPGQSEHGPREEEPAEARVLRTHISAHIVLLWELSMGAYYASGASPAQRLTLRGPRVADPRWSARDLYHPPVPILLPTS